MNVCNCVQTALCMCMLKQNCQQIPLPTPLSLWTAMDEWSVNAVTAIIWIGSTMISNNSPIRVAINAICQHPSLSFWKLHRVLNMSNSIVGLCLLHHWSSKSNSINSGSHLYVSITCEWVRVLSCMMITLLWTERPKVQQIPDELHSDLVSRTIPPSYGLGPTEFMWYHHWEVRQSFNTLGLNAYWRTTVRISFAQPSSRQLFFRVISPLNLILKLITGSSHEELCVVHAIVLLCSSLDAE